MASHPYTVDSSGCVVSVPPSPGTGYALFPLAGGGLCPGDSILVEVSGLILGYVWRVASLDQNGDLKVDSVDVAIVQSKVGTADPSADFDGDGQVTAADVAIVRAHLGHHAPEAINGVPVRTPGVQSLSAAEPNPFWRETRFTLTLNSDAPVDVSLYDLSGRRVATVFHGDLSPGSHDFAWDGRRADGSRSRSGVYFVHVRAGGDRMVRKAVLLGGS